jgi:RNA polymerase sigma-70 factor (ECF subfamily)
MAGESPTVTPEELLAYADWVGRLARALVKSSAEAEDLAQDAFEVALTRSPRREGPLRPWLGGILRNLARKRARTSVRRARRETRAAEPGTEAPSPELLVERAEAQQVVARHVLELDEPLRSTLLLRYYEGLNASQISERLGIPAGTVRWRLSRGLDVLRARLDEAHGGDRRRWAVMLVPLAGADKVVGAMGAGAALAKGVLVMKGL